MPVERFPDTNVLLYGYDLDVSGAGVFAFRQGCTVGEIRQRSGNQPGLCGRAAADRADRGTGDGAL